MRRKLVGIGPLLGLLGGLLMGATPAQALDMEAFVGFGQGGAAGTRYRPDTPAPLTVHLTGPGVRGKGQLQVIMRQNDQSNIFTKPVSLREGILNETYRFVVNISDLQRYYGFGNSGRADFLVQLMVDGRKIAEKKLTVPIMVSPETYNVLALTRDGSGLNFLTKKKLGLIHRHYNPEYLTNRYNSQPNTPAKNGINPNATLQVHYMDPRALPDMAQGYEMMDAIALADLPLEALTEDQTEAMKEYVRQGGLLIVSGGADIARLKSKFFADTLPLEHLGAANVGMLPELEQRYQEPLPLAGGTVLTTGNLKPEARSLFGQINSTPHVSSLNYGCGVVVYTAFDLFSPELKGWAAAPSLWRDLLRCGNNGISPRHLLASRIQENNGTQRLIDELAGKQATRVPPFSTIALFLGAYIFLLVPCNYLLLKRMDKREFAWFTAPILILSFSAISYAIASSIKGGAMTVHRAVILETSAGSHQWVGYGQFTLYSPRRATYDISLGSPNDGNNPYRSVVPGEIAGGNFQRPNPELTIEHDKTATFRKALVRTWDKRSFETPVRVSLDGPIEAQVQLQPDGQARVTVTNRTRLTIHDCALVNRDRVAPLGDLAPGATKSGVIKWVRRGGITTISLPARANASGLITDPQQNITYTPEEVQGRIRDALQQTLIAGSQGGGYYGGYASGGSGYGNVANAVVGWTYDPLLDVRVDGKEVGGQETNLLYVHLAPPSKAAPDYLRAVNPFLSKAVTELEEELAPGNRARVFP